MKISETLRMALPTILGLIFAVVMYKTLHEIVSQIHYGDIVHELNAVSNRQLMLAGIMTMISYFSLMITENIALRVSGLNISVVRAGIVSFLSQAIVHTTGFGLILGTSLRYRLYRAQGLSLADVTRSQIVFSSGFGASTLLLLAAVITYAPHHLAKEFGGGEVLWRTLGGVTLFCTGTFLGWSLSGKPMQMLGRTIDKKSVSLSLVLIVLSCIDLLACTAVLYAFLPATLNAGYLTVVIAFVCAIVVGLISHVPGGIGVFEATILLLLSPSLPLVPGVVGALLLFRCAYYLIPFLVASTIFAVSEVSTFNKAGKWLTPIAPLSSALVTATTGAVLVLSGTKPVPHSSLAVLGEWVPLQVIEASHLLASIVGLVMLLIAHGLNQRLREARWIAIILSATGVVLSLIKGLEVTTAGILFFNMLILLIGKRAFYRRGSFFSSHLTPGWWVAIGAVLSASLWLLLFSYRHVQYSNELWWQLELHAQVSRSLRAWMAAAVVTLMFGLWHLLHPAKIQQALPDHAGLVEIKTSLKNTPDYHGWIALTGDKNILWNDEKSAFLMYGVQGHTWAALGEPIGARDEKIELNWKFLEMVDAFGGRPAFYQVGSEQLSAYVDLGLYPYKIGESASVNLTDFSLQGKKKGTLRTSCNRIEKAGGRFDVISVEDVPAIIDELEHISDQWMAQHQAREKRFSLGNFSRDYIMNFPIAVVRIGDRIVAFANIWPGAKGATMSIDLMRYIPDAPNGCMDYLLVRILFYAQQQGYASFDLGVAPLSGLPTHPLAGNWAQVARIFANHGERYYNFKGLRSYKEKFEPSWQPCYLVCKPRQLTRVLLDISTLISGGIRGIIAK